MKHFLLIIATSLTFNLVGQNCELIRKTSKKTSNIESKGGSAASKDFNLLLIEKHFDPENPNDSTNFSAMIMIGSRYELSDSVTNSMGTFNFHLSNGQIHELNGATVTNLGNVLMGAPNTIMFRVEGTAQQFQPLSEHFIQRLQVFNIIDTEFKTKSQKQLLSIVGCLVAK